VLVVGSKNSSNSLRLVELAQRHGIPSYLIDDPGDIRAAWLDGVEVVGVTAGASAPARLVDAVIAALAELGPVRVVEREITRENIRFTLPPAVRRS
jgi:4-hydroxy-3-methylbut-2-enyl diphosphate reductase